MNNVYNTPFEVSLRVLLMLESYSRQWFSADRIAGVDFITVYSGDFGITDKNLHGDNSYKYSEFALRRETVREALKTLVSRQLVDVKSTHDGFMYALGKLGGDYCAQIESSYAQSYRELSVAVKEYTNSKTDRKLLEMINEYAISSLQRRDHNG